MDQVSDMQQNKRPINVLTSIEYLLPAAATPGGQLFRGRQQRLLKRQQITKKVVI